MNIDLNKVKAGIRAARIFIGNVWGKTTTLALSLSGIMGGALAIPGLQPLLSGFSWFPYLTVAIGVLGFVGRTWAPPPPAVSMPEGTMATKVDDNTIVIHTEAPLPTAVVEAEKTMPNVPGTQS